MRLRTIETAYQEMITADKNTALTRFRLRELVLNGEIPSRKSGNRYIINMDDVEKYFGVRG